MHNDAARVTRENMEEVMKRRPSRLLGILGQFALAALLLLCFYGPASVWERWPRMHQIVFERGVIPYVTMVLALIALADLIWKMLAGWFVESQGRKALVLREGGALSDPDLIAISENLRACSEHRFSPLRYSRWLHRLAVGLLQFARGDTKESVREALHSSADADEAALVSRYLIVKVLIWALPLLGFIGTVQGIGDGIGRFSETLTQQTRPLAVPGAAAFDDGAGAPAPAPAGDPMMAVKNSLREVTDGLGLAFDTTYLALILTVFLMVLLTVTEKVEANRLTVFAQMAEMNFVGRLPAAESQSSSLINAEDLGRLTAGIQDFRDAVDQAEAAAGKFDGLKDSLDDVTSALLKGVQCTLSLGDRPKK